MFFSTLEIIFSKYIVTKVKYLLFFIYLPLFV